MQTEIRISSHVKASTVKCMCRQRRLIHVILIQPPSCRQSEVQRYKSREQATILMQETANKQQGIYSM